VCRIWGVDVDSVREIAVFSIAATPFRAASSVG